MSRIPPVTKRNQQVEEEERKKAEQNSQKRNTQVTALTLELRSRAFTLGQEA